MKIVSNFKDYYDFLIGKYGIDPKVVYERVCETETPQHSWVKSGIYRPEYLDLPGYYYYGIAFCGTTYKVCCYNGKVYIGDEVLVLRKFVDKENAYKLPTEREYLTGHNKPTDVNEKLNCPVVLLPRYTFDGEGTKNVKLADFQFGRLVPPEDAYLRIVEFLTREPIIKDTRTDIEKVVSHGFDKKTSFRKM